jgi:hypothetical protein
LRPAFKADKKKMDNFMNNVKQEVKGVNSNFDLEHLSPEKRKLLKQRHKYEKQKNEIKLNRPSSARDEALKKSMMIINKSTDARRIIEEVMERAKLTDREKEESANEMKQMNGFVYKAYNGLLKKGETINEDKIKTNDIKDRDQLYDYVYFKKSKYAKNTGSKGFHPFLADD